MDTERLSTHTTRLTQTVLVWILTIGLLALPETIAPKAMAHASQSNAPKAKRLDYLSGQHLSGYHFYFHLTLPPIKQYTSADTPSQDSLARKLAQQRYQLAQQCSLSWQETEVMYNMLFPIGRADRVYSFYNSSGVGVSDIRCFQRTNGKIRLIYHIYLVYHERRVTKDKPVHVRTRYRTLLDYVTQAMPDDPDNPTTVGYFTLPRTTSRDVRKDLALKRNYVFYSENRFNDLLYTWLMYDMDKRGKFGDVYSMSKDPFTKASLSDDQFYEKYGLPVTREELNKIRFGKKRQPSHHTV